ncbi:MAG: hypothetical protein CMD33_01080 [Flavobacteriales bacterium]|nr:hypothetical protein [Flavobacteriales bacterium]
MATFSPTFSLDVTDDFAIGASRVVTNPGQAIEIIGIFASGTNNAVVTVSVASGTIGTCKIVSADGGSSFDIADAKGAVLATENITVAVATAAVDRVTLLCRSATPKTWVNS